ncbi:MAG TPA: ABC transporter substrate-binding protein [Candidatus Binatia bacterium]|nr:ABC transporter substrate-binding protein [Candidatus Binatia bacterium]
MKRLFASFLCIGLISSITASVRAQSSAPIAIGAVISYTGLSAPLGLPEKRAFELAEKVINSKGGVLGRPIHIEIQDDEAKPDVAAQIATSMIGKGVVALLCGTRVATTEAVARVTAASGTPQMIMVPDEASWRTRDGSVLKNVFQMIPGNDLEATALLQFAKTKLHAKTIALLHDDNVYGVAIEGVMLKQAKAMGVDVVADQAYPGTATDFTPQIVAIRDSKADVMMLLGATLTTAIATRNARSLGLKIPIVGTSGIQSDGYLKAAGSAAEGAFTDGPLDMDHPSPQLRAFEEAYRAAYNEIGDSKATSAWDAVSLIVDAIKYTKGKTDAASINAAIEKLSPWHGANGTFRFTPTDHGGLVNVTDVHIAVAKSGNWVTVQ